MTINPEKHKEAGLITKKNIHQLDFSGVTNSPYAKREKIKK
jgi:hypothetical protein